MKNRQHFANSRCGCDSTQNKTDFTTYGSYVSVYYIKSYFEVSTLFSISYRNNSEKKLYWILFVPFLPLSSDRSFSLASFPSCNTNFKIHNRTSEILHNSRHVKNQRPICLKSKSTKQPNAFIFFVNASYKHVIKNCRVHHARGELF
jgi:hypothetical protein